MAPSHEMKKKKNADAQRRFRERRVKKQEELIVKNARLENKVGQLEKYIERLHCEGSRYSIDTEESLSQIDLGLGSEYPGCIFDLNHPPSSPNMDRNMHDASRKSSPTIHDAPVPTAKSPAKGQVREFEQDYSESRMDTGHIEASAPNTIFTDHTNDVAISVESWIEPYLKTDNQNFDDMTRETEWQPRPQVENPAPSLRVTEREPCYLEDCTIPMSSSNDDMFSSLDYGPQTSSSIPWGTDSYWSSMSLQTLPTCTNADSFDPMKPYYVVGSSGLQDNCQSLRNILQYVQSVLLCEQTRCTAQPWLTSNAYTDCGLRTTPLSQEQLGLSFYPQTVWK